MARLGAVGPGPARQGGAWVPMAQRFLIEADYLSARLGRAWRGAARSGMGANGTADS